MNSYKIRMVFLSSFLISFSYGILLTLPLFFTKYLSTPISFAGKIIFIGITGVFPAIIFIPKLYRYISNEKLISTGCLIYASAIALIISNNTFLYYLAGILFGVGWGMVYTLGPIIISQLSNDNNRANNFSYISAFNMLGAGLSPVLVGYLDSHGFSMYNVYYFACLLSLIAGISFLFCGVPVQQNTAPKSVLTGLSVRSIVSTKAMTPMVMVFLGACIFSSMMNFQTVIAEAKGLDFSYFYISYTASVIICRFFLTRFVNSFTKELMIVLLLAVMALSIFLMNFVNDNLFYIVPSALLGLSYGLAYPLIQNASIKYATSENERKNNLTFFSLCYFIGVYAFPYLFTVITSGFGYKYSLGMLILISMLELALSVLLFRKREQALDY